MTYSLRLISQDLPSSPEEIHCSNQMIAWGIHSELSKIFDVSVDYYNAVDQGDPTGWLEGLKALPKVDFTLIHSYTPGPIFGHLELVRTKTDKQVLWVSECPYAGMDHCFTFLPFADSTQIPLPALMKILDESRRPKLPGSVLLDHAWSWSAGYANFEGTTPNLWCDRLYKWLEPLKDQIVVAQLESLENEQISGVHVPWWVRKIPCTYYVDYLKLTAPFENFIMTHPGSYEHSIIDMAARGIRVLVPTPTVPHYHKDGWAIDNGGNPFAPRDTVERLRLKTFSNRMRLLSELMIPPDEDWRRSLFTDAPQMASIIDQHCRRN